MTDETKKVIFMARRKSLYEIIYAQIEQEVQKMSDGTQLPSIDKLCEDYGASKTVIREVITALEKDGLVVRRQGLGTFVVKDSGLVHTGIEYLRGLTRIISSSGKTPDLVHDAYRVVEADEELATRLETEMGQHLVLTERVYAADGVPAIFARTFIASERVPGGTQALVRTLGSSKAKELTLFDLMEENFKEPIRYAIAEIESTLVDRELSRLLQIEKRSSIVLLKEVHRDMNNIPMLYSEDFINTAVFRIHVLRKKI